MKQILVVLFTLILSACTSLPIEKQVSKGQDSRVKSLILHFTAGNYKRSIFALRDSGAVSAHYVVPDSSFTQPDLKIIQLVDEQNRAWHAGYSYWQDRHGLNDTSIGIEIVNSPQCEEKKKNRYAGGEFAQYRQCQFSEFEPDQIELVIKLAKDILSRHQDIHPTRVVGHSDIAPGRKNDPGPTFPWFQLYQNGIGAWYDEDTYKQYQEMFNFYHPSIGLTQKALKRYGYSITETGMMDNQTQDVLFAFQSHFLPENITGIADVKTLSALFSLLEKYLEFTHSSILDSYFNEAESYFAYIDEQARPNNADVQLSNDKQKWIRFKSIEGHGQVTLSHPNFRELNNMSLAVNGHLVHMDVSNLDSEHSLEVDISDRTINGSNLVLVNSTSSLKYLTLEVTSPKLIQNNTNVVKQQELDVLAQNAALKGQLMVVNQGNWLIKKSYNSESTKIELGRLSSVFTIQLALMRLASEDKIDFNKPVSFYWPQYSGDGRESRTIKDFLQHQSGYLEQPESQATFEKNHILHQVFHFGLKSRIAYSQLNDLVLQRVIEEVTGQSLFEYLQKNIYQPLQLHNTQLVLTKDLGLVQLQTDTNDLSILLQLILNEGGYGTNRIFSKSDLFTWFTQQQSVQPQVNDSEVSFLNCLPYLQRSVPIYSDVSGQMLLFDHHQQLFIYISSPPQQQLNTDLFRCGLSLFHIDIINRVYRAIIKEK